MRKDQEEKERDGVELVQSAGEQKYYEFVRERDKNLRLGRVIWVSLLAVALLACLSGTGIRAGIILGIVGIVLAVVNTRSMKAFSSKLDGIADRRGFFDELIAPDTLELPEYRLILTRNYVLRFKEDVFIYCLGEMEKLEVGIRREGAMAGKTLFLTDRDGVRHEIASCAKGSGMDEAFDRAYFKLKENMDKRTE